MSLSGHPSSRSSAAGKNIRKSQSDVGMRTARNNFELNYFEDDQFRETAASKLKRHLSDETAEINCDDDVGAVEPRKRNKENSRVDEVPRAFKAQTDGWLRVRNHVVNEHDEND